MSAIVQARLRFLLFPLGLMFMLIRDCSHAFPDQPFKQLSCDPNDPDTSYTSFVTGNHPFAYDPSTGISMWRILDRGNNTKADKLLDWLVRASTDSRS